MGLLGRRSFVKKAFIWNGFGIETAPNLFGKKHLMQTVKNTGLLAGAATVDITPELGIQLAGDIGRLRPIQEIRERLYAHTLVLEWGETQCALIVMDLCLFSNGWSDEIRRRIAARTGIPFESIAIMATQTHAAPALGNTFCRDSCTLFPPEYPWLRGGDDRYNEPTASSIVAAVAQAAETAQPVRVKVGRSMDARVAFNRRFILRNGQSLCQPMDCDPTLLHTEGPVDPEVGVLTIGPADGPPLSALLHHTCHPCHGYPHLFTLSGWPGAWRREFASRHGSSLVPLVLNGCCGNIIHHNYLDPTPPEDSHLRIGQQLADTSEKVMGQMANIASTPLGVQRSILKLPLRRVAPDELAAAQKILTEHPTPLWVDTSKTAVVWDWVYAVSTIDLAQWVAEAGTFDYEIQAFRIGDAAVVTLMGEPFVEGQLAIKLRSPAPFTFVAHMANGYAGYVPTDGALQRGGTFETRVSQWSKFQPGALDAIVERALSLLNKLFP